MTDCLAQLQADLAQLQQIIVDLTDGIIILHPAGTIAWANEAALAMHGIRTFADLGGTASGYRGRFDIRYRNHHQLAPAEYPMDRILAGEVFSQVIVEVMLPGDERRWVHQIRGLALTDGKGQRGLLVLILEDQTQRFSAEDRFERAFDANPAPALIVRLSDMRYVKVNHGFLQMTGFSASGLIGRSMHELDILDGAENRALAVERLHDGRTVPQMEACLTLPPAGEKMVLLAGQPIEIGDEACMLFTFADLHPRKQAEDALRQSEERFAKAFRLAPGPMAMVALKDWRILDVNGAFTAATGWRREEVVGRVEPDIELWGSDDTREQFRRQVQQTGHVHSLDIQVRGKDGRLGDYLLSAETVTIWQEPCVLTVMLDITQRKQTEMQLLHAVEAVMRDTSWFGQKIVEKLASLSRSNVNADLAAEVNDLTPRAREVLGLIAQGLSDAEIASRLSVSQNTIRNHASAIYRALGVHRRAAVVVWARERGLGGPANPEIKPRKAGRSQTG